MNKELLKTVINRLRDKATLLLVATQLIALFVLYGVMDAEQAAMHREAVGIIVGILAVVGILRDPNPTDKDDQDEE